jgi:hypothetical protein
MTDVCMPCLCAAFARVTSEPLIPSVIHRLVAQPICCGTLAALLTPPPSILPRHLGWSKMATASAAVIRPPIAISSRAAAGPVARAPCVVYVLQCEQGKYYVGRAADNAACEVRFQRHQDGTGAEWTRRYRPIRTLERFVGDHWDEETSVFRYMQLYGVDNVRGGMFSQMELSDEQRRNVLNMIHSANDECFRCGAAGHFARQCPSSGASSSEPAVSAVQFQRAAQPLTAHTDLHRMHSIPSTIPAAISTAIASAAAAAEIVSAVLSAVTAATTRVSPHQHRGRSRSRKSTLSKPRSRSVKLRP